VGGRSKGLHKGKIYGSMVPIEGKRATWIKRKEERLMKSCSTELDSVRKERKPVPGKIRGARWDGKRSRGGPGC